MEKERVLFICVHNSARSQMAEAYLNAMAGDRFTGRSAGFNPDRLNEYAVRAMAEDGIDISRHGVTDVFELYRKGETFTYVITVCDEARAEKCPVFPGLSTRLHWSFQDPATVEGSDAK